MKRLILALTLLILCFCSPVFSAEYVYINDNPLVIKKLPKRWTFINGSKTGNFNIMPTAALIAEGWREVTIDNSTSYDPEIENAGDWEITIFADHAEKTRTISDKAFPVVRKEKRRKVIREGNAILRAKYENPWEEGYAADKATLNNYFLNTIQPLIMAGGQTRQQIKNINDGDEYTWPSIGTVEGGIEKRIGIR